MHRPGRLSVLLAILILAACSGGQPAPDPPDPPNDPTIHPGALDSAFGDRGVVLYEDPSGALSNEEAFGVALQPDGKIVVTGYIRSEAPVFRSALVLRYNPDGSLDGSFGANGAVTFEPESGAFEARAVAIQADGKIVVVGDGPVGNPNVFVARLNADGALDSGFGAGGVALIDVNYEDHGYAVEIQPDGKIVVAGMTATASDRYALVFRCDSNGTLDGTFGAGGVVTYDSPGWDAANGIAIQADGRIVVTGSTSPPYPEVELTDVLVLRFNADGTPDGTFGEHGVVTFDAIYEKGIAVEIQPDGRIVIAGGIWSYNSLENKILVLGYGPDGTLDGSFGTGGVVTYNQNERNYMYGRALAIQPDGKIVVAGYISDDYGIELIILRYGPNGVLDNEFGDAGVGRYRKNLGATAGAYGLALQSDGKIIAAGNSTQHDRYTDFAVLVLRVIGR